MSESNSLPKAISHKKLYTLMVNAKKDETSSSEQFKTLNSELEEFENRIKTWEFETKDLLRELSKINDDLFKDKTPNALMALGAMEVHINMAIQALKAFKEDNKE